MPVDLPARTSTAVDLLHVCAIINEGRRHRGSTYKYIYYSAHVN